MDESRIGGVCVRAWQRPSPAPPPPGDANGASGARLHNPLAWRGRRSRRGAPSRCDNRRANTFHQLFFLYWKLMRQRAPRHFNSNRNSHNISKPNKTSSWILHDSEAGNVTIRGCDEIVKSINTVITSKKYLLKYFDSAKVNKIIFFY